MTPRPQPDTERTTLETALEHIPVGCTLIIYRTDSPPGYRIQLRDDTPLRSYEAGYVRESTQVGEAAMGAIEHQHSYEAMAVRNWQSDHVQHVTVSPETKQRLMAEYGLTESDFTVPNTARQPTADDSGR